MKEKILKKLQMFQEAYDKRDVEQADALLKNIFDLSDDISILGTSGGELCLGYDAVKQIFVDDWKYWSFEHIDFDHLEMKEYGDYILVYAPSYFSHTFKENEENYGNYLKNIEEELKDGTEFKRKLSETNWVLHHFFHQRENNPRKYLFELRVCFIFKKINDDVLIKQIQFSVTEDLNDAERLFPSSWFNDGFKEERDLLKNQNTLMEKDLKERFLSFINDFSQHHDMQSYFSDECLLLSVDHKKANEKKEIEPIISELQAYWNELTIKEDSIYVKQDGNTAYLITYGLTNNQKSEEEVYQEMKEKIEEINLKEISNKQKLFEIRKQITKGFKEISIGETYQYPVRIHALLQKENNIWLFKYLQFSYHYFYILENKNEYQHLVCE